MKNKIIYFDNAATTKVYPEVIKAMIPFHKNLYGNASSIYSLANISKSCLEDSRQNVANLLGANENEIFFTSGATEANNWAILGIVEKFKKNGNHIITSSIEHPAVLNVFKKLEKNGFEVTYLPVDKNGIISIKSFINSLKKNTIFASIMMVNNEIGTIQPVFELSKIAKKNNIIFHTDAVQYIGKKPIKLKDTCIDLLSLSAHKFHGPKGIGALYIKNGIQIENFFEGGSQEKNKRPGTENIPNICGLSKALEISLKRFNKNEKKILKLKKYLLDKIFNKISHIRLNGDKINRISNNINISFSFIEGESLLLSLDMHGICVSSGSACTSGSLNPSHVLLAMGLNHEEAHGSLRITLSEFNTKNEIKYFLQIIPQIVNRLRSMSPLYDDYIKKEGKK